MHDVVLIGVVEKIARFLDDHQVPWCVLRNYESFPRPRSDASDLDMLVQCPKTLIDDALRIAISDGDGLVGTVITRNGGEVISVFIGLPGSPTLHLDFIYSVAWAAFPLLDCALLLANRRLSGSTPIPQPGHEAAVSLFTHLFHQGTVKDSYRDRIQSLVSQDRGSFIACVAPVWGLATANEIAQCAEIGDWRWFGRWLPTAKRRLLFQFWRRPLLTLLDAVRLASNIVRRVVSPPGLWVAFLGPDGAGKSTVATAYCNRLVTLFYPSRQKVFHWRPRWLPAPGRIAGRVAENDAVTNPHAKEAHGIILSLLRLTYFWVDYVAGYWVRVRPILAKGGLVVFDRYFQDFYIDRRRFRLGLPLKAIGYFELGVPQPNLIFVLYAPSAVLHARKQELSESEISFQLEALRKLAPKYSQALIIRVDRPVEEIVDELERDTLRYLDRRARRQLGWTSVGTGYGEHS